MTETKGASPKFTNKNGWVRSRADLVSKYKSLSDFEIVSMLIGQHGGLKEGDQNEIYKELQSLNGIVAKAFAASLTAFGICALSYAGGVETLSAVGMAVKKPAFAPLSLIAWTMANLWFSISFSKASQVAGWFEWLHKRAGAPERAYLMLRYPQAYWYFSYYRGARGFPNFIYPLKTGYAQLIPLLLIVVGLVAYMICALSLYGSLVVRVWNSGFPTVFLARLIAIGSVFLTALAGLTPISNQSTRPYRHHGLSGLLNRASPERKTRGYERIVRAASNMKIVVPNDGD